MQKGIPFSVCRFFQSGKQSDARGNGMEVLYAFMGLIVARLLEKRKLRSATVAHAVLFVIVAFFMLLIPDSGYIAEFSKAILSEEAFRALRFALVEDAVFLAPAVNILGFAEILIVLISLLIVVAVIASDTKPAVREKAIAVCPKTAAVRRIPCIAGKIYLKYCRILS